MQAIMKQEKMRPCSKCSPLGLSAGVHRNTNVYMLVSNSDCIAPSSAILGSARRKRNVAQCTDALLTYVTNAKQLTEHVACFGMHKYTS